MSGNVTTTASDIITGALINITAYAIGQPLDNQVASTCMQVLNDLLDSLSTDQAFIYTQTENILQWTPGQFQYTVGNPVGGVFTGTLTLGSPVIMGTTTPAGVITLSDITDVQALGPGRNYGAFHDTYHGDTKRQCDSEQHRTGSVHLYHPG